MNKDRLREIGTEIAGLIDKYHNGPKREMLLDPTLYAYLRGSGRTVQRQYPARLPGGKRTARIDFRLPHPNAVLIEFAVRPPVGGGQLYGSQNKSELFKLCRFNNAKAKLRALLLVDLSPFPITKSNLRASYDCINAGRGRFARFPVRVVYAHKNGGYTFCWSPKAS